MKPDKRRWNSWCLPVPNLRIAKRIVVAVIGGTVTLIGIALIVLPGPAFIVIPIGLSILATEFLWAKRGCKSFAGLRVLSRQNRRATRDHTTQSTVSRQPLGFRSRHSRKFRIAGRLFLPGADMWATVGYGLRYTRLVASRRSTLRQSRDLQMCLRLSLFKP